MMRDKQTPTKIQRKRKLKKSSIHNIIARRTHVRTSLSTATVNPTLHLCCPCMFDHQTHAKSSLIRAMQYGEEEVTSPLQCKWMVLSVREVHTMMNSTWTLPLFWDFQLSVESMFSFRSIPPSNILICTWGLYNATNILSTILLNNTMLQRWSTKQGKLDSITLNALLTPNVTSFKISLGFRLQGDVVACGANKFGDSHKIPPQPKKP